ncbi:hypothetical protein TSAR_015766, partial [Trichomalopsis sarcophagae]
RENWPFASRTCKKKEKTTKSSVILLISKQTKNIPPWCITDPKWLPACRENDFIDAPFNFLEFNIALECKNPDSSSGTDGIDYEILQKMPLKYKRILVDIFNEIASSPKSKKLLEKVIDTIYDHLYDLGLELAPQKT